MAQTVSIPGAKFMTKETKNRDAGGALGARGRRGSHLQTPTPSEAPVLPDGQTVCVRAAAPEDGERLRRMFSRLSGESQYRRFHSPFSRVPEWVVNQAVEADHYDRESLIALIDGEIVGQAMYVRLENGDEAEVAVVVEDGWQRRGIGYLLLFRLAEKARNHGIRAFTGAVLPENGAMRALVASSGALRYSKKDGVFLAHAPLRVSGPARRTSDGVDWWTRNRGRTAVVDRRMTRAWQPCNSKGQSGRGK